MQTEKKLTGYPSIDKPWLKFYTENAVRAQVPECSIYGYMWENNKDHLQDIAIDYFGRKINYKQLFTQIDKFASALMGFGVKCGDVVSIISLTTPEAIISFYALNKIGAIANMEYVTQTETSLKKSLEETKSRIVIILDMFLPAFQEALDCKTVEKVVVLSPLDMMSIPAKIIAARKLKSPLVDRDEKYISYNDFFHLCKGDAHTLSHNSSNLPAAYVSTSGSTGIPKKVILTNQNINSVVFQYFHSGMDIRRGDTLIGIAPPFLAFGITLTIHLPLCCGVTSILNFNPDPGSSVELFAKKKPNHFLGGVIHVRKLMESPLCKKINLSKLRTIAIGGESLSPTQCVEVNEFLRGHGAPTQLITGYGMTELSSTVSTEKDGACKIGSIGIPQCKAIVKVVDTETQEELPYKAVGELHFSSPSAMVGYLNNADETNATLYSDPQGTKWVRTGDLGYIDEDGFVFIVGRIKRIFLTYSPQTSQAFKLFPSYIENEIEKCSFVDRCAVVVVPHSEFMNVPVAFVSLKDKVANAEDIINQQLSLAIAEYNLPYKYYFVDRFPFLASGKIDYRALEKEIKI